MMSNLHYLPLALTVMLGPQILVPMILITRKDPVKSSLVYILTLSTSLCFFTFLYYYLISTTHMHTMSMHGKPIFKYLLVGIFIFLIIKNIINRKKLTKPPKWMANINDAPLKKIALIAFLLIAIMPGDIAVIFTVAGFLNLKNSTLTEIIPFVSLVTFIASTPLLVYFSFGKKGNQLMSSLNNWLNTHGYLINVMTLMVFIYLILS
ncbi:GAP family protein [Bizionia arctica]|nr:GAP family protein [Bizionia arctica]